MTPVLKAAQIKVVQQNPFVQFAREPISLSAFELEPSTSYGQLENRYNGSRCTLSMRTSKKRRHRRRTLQMSSATAALQPTSLQNDCFAALGAQIRKSARHHMMGWPADVRRFLAGAFAGEHQAPFGWETFYLCSERGLLALCDKDNFQKCAYRP